jgi:hypothetical protein
MEQQPHYDPTASELYSEHVDSLLRRRLGRRLTPEVSLDLLHSIDGVAIVRVTSTMYARGVKSVTITIPDELDARAAAEARRRGVSKSELIRIGLTAVMPAVQEVEPDDPWQALSGFGSIDVTVTPGEIDDVVYGG